MAIRSALVKLLINPLGFPESLARAFNREKVQDSRGNHHGVSGTSEAIIQCGHLVRKDAKKILFRIAVRVYEIRFAIRMGIELM